MCFALVLNILLIYFELQFYLKIKNGYVALIMTLVVYLFFACYIKKSNERKNTIYIILLQKNVSILFFSLT